MYKTNYKKYNYFQVIQNYTIIHILANVTLLCVLTYYILFSNVTILCNISLYGLTKKHMVV